MVFLCEDAHNTPSPRRASIPRRTSIGTTSEVPGLDERLRTQALSRYFTSAQITPNSKSAGKLPVAPTLSHDITLTGLAQNGALRLNCDRAFISLLDTSTQYIIAEATRTISLRSRGSYSSPQDALFLGVQALHKSYGVCPNTVSVFTDTTGEKAVHTEQILANSSRYVIRDFRKLAEYKDKPYVAGFPHMRSYAEVPLKTSTGSVIGSYCVVDTVVRDDFFEDAPVMVLDEIASSIMGYLELATVRHNHDRGERLMEGLSLFADGKSSFAEVPDANTGNTDLDGEGKDRRSSSPPSTALAPDVFPLTLDGTLPLRPREVADCAPTSPPRHPSEQDTPTLAPANRVAPDLTCTSTEQHHQGPEEETLTPKLAAYTDTFSRAANLIKEALDMDGLVFLDASTHSVTDSSSESDVQANDAGESGDDDAQRGAQSRHCPVLGSSLGRQVNPSERTSTCAPPLLRESSLRRLAKAYPHGHVFLADEHGLLSAERDRSEDHSGDASIDEYVPSELREFLHDARSVIFLPLWNFSKAQFFAGTLGWTADPTRIFEKDDFTCLSAFGDSLMTELERLEVVDLSRSKTDFISSISHELRSPLHGILASAELLRDALIDGSQTELVRMIESCGTTLLDTMNHLLDFSKINSFDSSKGHARKAIESPTTVPNEPSDVSVQDLSELVEDVCEGVHIGHHAKMAANRSFGNDNGISADQSAHTTISTAFLPHEAGTDSCQDPDDPRVAILMELEKRRDWQMPLRVGAWKRVVMNLFANALKYTRNGQIEIALRRLTLKNRSGLDQDFACFVIKDTGIGMSEDYLKHKLFKPFSQENAMVPGTGLGLSIVKQIVTTLGGTIDVQSQAGVGTRIQVLVPILSVPLDNRLVVIPPPHILDSVGLLQGRSLCLVSSSGHTQFEDPSVIPSSIRSRKMLSIGSLIAKIASEWLGMTVTSSKSLDSPDADFYVVDHSYISDLASTQSATSYSSKRILSIGSRTSANVGQVRIGGRSVLPIRYPLGPRTLTKALLSALKNANEDVPVPSQTEIATPVQSQEDKTQNAPIKDAKDANHNEGCKHLLLVDDNAINLKILQSYVKKLGCTSVAAENGLEALNRYKTSVKPFDIIFMDISMPVMNGFESSQRIREFERQSPAHRARPTRIVALTGLGSEASRQDAIASGIDELRVKPVPLKDLKVILDAS